MVEFGGFAVVSAVFGSDNRKKSQISKLIRDLASEEGDEK